MDKVSLAKKTAKLMVDKLSPQELENELYQLLIMLPDSDLDYVHDDVESGNIAGAPLINNPQDTEEYLRTSTYVEGEEESEDEYGLSDYDIVYRFDTPSPTIAAGLYEETFDEGDDIYIYDEQNDAVDST